MSGGKNVKHLVCLRIQPSALDMLKYLINRGMLNQHYNMLAALFFQLHHVTPTSLVVTAAEKCLHAVEGHDSEE